MDDLFAKTVILRAVGNCPEGDALRRMESIQFEEETGRDPQIIRRRFEGWRAAVHEVCPQDVLARLFEAALNQEGEDSLFFAHKDLVRPKMAMDKLFTFCQEFPTPDFQLAAPARKNAGARKIFTQNEMYYAAEYMALLRPDIYLGINLLFNTVHAFADSGANWVKSDSKASVPQESLQAFNSLEPWLYEVFGRLKRETTISVDVPVIGAALCVAERAQNPMNPHITHPSPPVMKDALQWLYHAGYFRKNVRCPGSMHMLHLMTLPVFVGTRREGMALDAFIKKAGRLIAQDDFWRAKAAGISRELTEKLRARSWKEIGAYIATPSGRAMQRMRESLGDKPHLFASPKPPLALG